MSPAMPITETLGPLFIGLVVASLLFGITALQVFLYFTEYSSGDGWMFKTFVTAVILVDFLNIMLIAHGVYYTAVIGFGDYTILNSSTWSIAASLSTGVCAFPSKPLDECYNVISRHLRSSALLSFNAFMLGEYTSIIIDRKWMLPLIICLLALSEFALNIAQNIILMQPKYQPYPFYEAKHIFTTIICCTSIISMVCNLLITTTLTYQLWRCRSLVFESTNKIINSWVMYTLSTGLLPLIVTIINFCVFMHNKRSLYILMSFWICVRLFPCSFMSTLNSRNNMRRNIEHEHEGVSPSTDTTNGMVMFTHFTSEATSTATTNRGQHSMVGDGLAGSHLVREGSSSPSFLSIHEQDVRLHEVTTRDRPSNDKGVGTV